MRFGFGGTTAKPKSDMGGTDLKPTPTPAPLIPQTGAAPYWYVDPAASRNFNPMQNWDEQGHTDFTSIPTDTPKSQIELQQLEEALKRIGVLPANQPMGF